MSTLSVSPEQLQHLEATTAHAVEASNHVAILADVISIDSIKTDSETPLVENELALQQAFRFDLENHQLQDPQTSRGEVVGLRDMTEEVGLGCAVFEINVKDPYVEADPQAYKKVSDHIAKMEQIMLNDGFDPLVGRQEAQSESEWNAYTRAWLHADNVDGLRLWRDFVPTAVALNYLTNPIPGTVIAGKAGDAGVISKETAAYLRFVDDAVAIRDRGTAMQTIAEQHLSSVGSPDPKGFRWLSLASGTAEPSLIAAKNIIEKYGTKVDLTVTDWDRSALKFVSSNAERIGFDSSDLHTVRANILSPELPGKLVEKTGTSEDYDVVENMGFEEYLPQDGDPLEAYKGKGLPQASDFTRTAFEMVKPGGILISGNMVLDRPQLDFVFGIVDWPLINARSEDAILRVYKAAGILDDPRARVEMFRVKNETTNAHVYNIVKVTKVAE